MIDEGTLKGFVSVNRSWKGFSKKDYKEARESVYENTSLQDSGNAEELDLTVGGMLS